MLFNILLFMKRFRGKNEESKSSSIPVFEIVNILNE